MYYQVHVHAVLLHVGTCSFACRFREDIFHPGEIGGLCTLNKPLLQQHNRNKSPLQSWYAELEEYTGLDFNPFVTGYCDEVVTMPTVFIKLDAGKPVNHVLYVYKNICLVHPSIHLYCHFQYQWKLHLQRRQAPLACRREIVLVYGSIQKFNQYIRSNVVSIRKSGDSEGMRLTPKV